MIDKKSNRVNSILRSTLCPFSNSIVLFVIESSESTVGKVTLRSRQVSLTGHEITSLREKV